MSNTQPKLIITTALIGGLFAAPSFAGRDRDHDDRYGGVEYAKVVSAEPIYREVRVSQPRRECYEERVTYRERGAGVNVTAGTILGGIIGGVAGHQIGGGHGQDAATAIGAVVGAGIGNDAARRNSGDYTRTGYETRCDTVDDVRFEQRVEAYDVTYRYNGRNYHTQMPYDPGERIPVNVNVRPAKDY